MLYCPLLKTDAESNASYRNAYKEYLAGLKAKGKLLMGGRFADGTGGIYILQAVSEVEAESLADADSYHADSVRRFGLKDWKRKL